MMMLVITIGDNNVKDNRLKGSLKTFGRTRTLAGNSMIGYVRPLVRSSVHPLVHWSVLPSVVLLLLLLSRKSVSEQCLSC